MNEPTLNRELLLATMDRIEKFPEAHDQKMFVCPLYDEPKTLPNGDLCHTTFCYAGTASYVAGAEYPLAEALAMPPGKLSESEWMIDPVTKESVLTADLYEAYAAGKVPVNIFAKRELGLTDEQAHALFYEFGTHAHLRILIESFIKAEDAGVVWEPYGSFDPRTDPSWDGEED